MTDLNVEGMAIAPNVVETIVTLAVKGVDGVASLAGGSGKGGIRGFIGGKNAEPAIQVEIADDSKMTIAVHIEVKYGSVFPDVATNVRQAVADAVATQVGAEVSAVDVYIDGVQFEN